ncbi:MAG: CTP synthase [Candidatus Aenigmarchaeota archaeon]|nr:CTP synthase [Candidatus Aenigmarchaeota archaeon]
MRCEGYYVKLIVVSGGVMSGVGKGTSVAAIGRILQEYGFSVTAIKIDPYINYDAGTLRPTEHGEVWVTDDGGEIDQDLGNYERFLDIDIPKRNNITTGQVYKEVIDRERRGEFLGQTVQFIPHIPDEIKRRIREAGKNFDFVLIEIGGTIGDYENIPFLFAMKSLEVELGKENVVHILVTYLPVPSNIGEMKTKPTQQAIRMLNEMGIFPDFVLCRAAKPLDTVRKKKIEIYANIDSEHIISAPDVKTIYRVPLNFEAGQLGRKILAKVNLKPRKSPGWEKYEALVSRIETPSRTVKVAMVGKYVDSGDYSLVDSYISLNQALEHATAVLDIGVSIDWIDAKLLETKANLSRLEGYDGIIVPGGFGASGVEGKIAAIQYAREHNVPFLGLCYGMQLAVVEYARNVCGMDGAHTTEVNAETRFPVIDILTLQREILSKHVIGASMRLGAYSAILGASRVLDLYKRTGRLEKDSTRIERIRGMPDQLFRLGTIDRVAAVVLERHRHRYEVNPDFVGTLVKNGMTFPGFHVRDDGTRLMEFIELPDHRFFVGTQAHPEFKSRLSDPAPLYYGFVEACARSGIRGFK